MENLPNTRWGRARLALLAMLLWCTVLVTCSGEARRPNVILIGVDTLRPDHLGCYGYGRPTSPNIDRLAAGGVIFERTVSQAPWTLPSFGTVFTSLYPTQHGAGTLRTKMGATFPTLAGILSEAGYTTGAIVSAPVLDSATGIARGFEDYDIRPDGTTRTADEVTGLALKWLDERDGDPFFLFLHYWDPHDPYCPPAPYDTVFDPSYGGGLGNAVTLRMMGITSPEQVGVTLSEETGMISDRDLEHVVALYDGEIALVDRWIGELLRGLEQRGLKRNTLIVLHSDHGEEFLEHTGVGHGHSFYNEVIQVAMIMALPEVIPDGVRISRQVRLLDLTPTVLDLLGLDAGFAFEGISLAPALNGGVPAPREKALFPPQVAYSEAVREGPERKAVSAYPLKLIYELSSTDETLFDLGLDPGETENVIAGRRDDAHPLEDLLARALFEISDDWYVEVAGGETRHTFDIEISTEKATWGGWICPFDMDQEGKPVAIRGMDILAGSPGSVYGWAGLKTAEPVVTGFKIHAPRGVGTEFDFRIDGKPALASTFIGENLAQPGKMPFNIRKGRARAHAVTGPLERPEPPYVLVWHVEGQYGDEVPANLSEEVKKELRALGYIQ